MNSKNRKRQQKRGEKEAHLEVCLAQQKNLAGHHHQGCALSTRSVRQAQQLSSAKLSARLALSSNPLTRT